MTITEVVLGVLATIAAAAIAIAGFRNRRRMGSHIPPRRTTGGAKRPGRRSDVKIVGQPSIFMSYRRDDSADIAGRIYDRLSHSFGPGVVFKDVDSIPLGADFRKVVDKTLEHCHVVLAVIGDRWLITKDSEGNYRLSLPDDFVRVELEVALRRGVPIIPVLVRGASMPTEKDLSLELRQLAFRNAIQVRADPDFQNDIERLIGGLRAHLKCD